MIMNEQEREDVDVVVTHMYVCEIAKLILHPDQLYMFHVHDKCIDCLGYGL